MFNEKLWQLLLHYIVECYILHKQTKINLTQMQHENYDNTLKKKIEKMSDFVTYSKQFTYYFNRVRIFFIKCV